MKYLKVMATRLCTFTILTPYLVWLKICLENFTKCPKCEDFVAQNKLLQHLKIHQKFEESSDSDESDEPVQKRNKATYINETDCNQPIITPGGDLNHPSGSGLNVSCSTSSKSNSKLTVIQRAIVTPGEV